MTPLMQQLAAARHWLGSLPLPTPIALKTAATPGEKVAALIVCAEQGLATLHPDSGPIEIASVTIKAAIPDLTETVTVSAAGSLEQDTVAIVHIHAGATQLARVTVRTATPLDRRPAPSPLILLATPRTPVAEALAVQLGKQNHAVLLIDPLTRRAYWQDKGAVVNNPARFAEITDAEAILLDRGVDAALLFPEAAALAREDGASGWVAALFESLIKFQHGTLIELTVSGAPSERTDMHGFPLHNYSLPTVFSDESASEAADRILMGLMTAALPPPDIPPFTAPLDGVGLRDRLHTLLRRKLSLPPPFDLSVGGLSLTPGWDSLRHIQLLLEIEEHFEIEFTSGEIEKSTLVEQIEQLLIQKLHPNRTNVK